MADLPPTPGSGLRQGATKARPMGDRYFVINHYQGKNGPRTDVFELPTHYDATALAFAHYKDVIEMTGDENGESFEVFVGSKSELDRKLGRG